MSENQYLEIIDGKIDVVTNLIEQQSKTGAFFDSFTKQVLEKINNKLDALTNSETNELITFLSKEIKNAIEDRQLSVQEKLDGFQAQLSSIQANLVDSLKSPEIAAIFTKLSDTVLDFSRSLNSQTKYFNSTVEDIQKELAKVNVDEKFIEQTNSIRLDIERYKIDVASVVDSINSNFASMKAVIEENKLPEACLSFASDIDILQKGLNDILSVATVIENKQTDLLVVIKDIAAASNVEEVKLNVVSIFTELQTLNEALKVLADKSDLEFINEKIERTINAILDLKETTLFNDNENKAFLKNQIDELYSLVSSYIAKDETEFIKSKLEEIKTNAGVVEQNIEEEIRKLIPIISSLSTKEELKGLEEKTTGVSDSIVAQINDKFNAVLDLKEIILVNDNESKALFKKEIDELYSLISSYIAKDETEFIKSKLEEIKINTGVAEQNIEEEIRKLIPFLETLSTKESLKELSVNTTEIYDNLTKYINNKLLENETNYEVRLESLNVVLKEINEVLQNISIQQKNNDNSVIREDIVNIVESVSNISEQISDGVNISFLELKKQLDDLSLRLSEKIEGIESFTNYVQDKTNNDNEKIEELKDYLQKLITLNSTLTSDIELKSQEVKQNFEASLNKIGENVESLEQAMMDSAVKIAESVSGQNDFIRELETKVLLCADTTVENVKIVDDVNSSVKKLDNKIGELSEVCNSVSQKVEEKVEQQSALINTLESNIALTTHSIVEKAQIELEEKLNVITDTCGIINSQIGGENIGSNDSIKNLETKSAFIVNSVVENSKLIDDARADLVQISEKLEESETQRKTVKDEILSKINEVMVSLGEKLSQSFTQRAVVKEEIINSVKTVNEDISEKLNTSSEKIDKFIEEVTQLLGTSFANISQKTTEENVKNDEFKENLKIELEKTISEVTNKLIKAEEETSALSTNLLSAIDVAIKSINEKDAVQLENINNSFNQVQENIVKNIVDEISLDDLKIEISQDLALYSVSLKEKIDETIKLISSNKDYLETISSNNSTNIIDRIIDIKNDLAEIKLGNASGMVVAEVRRVGEKIEGWSNDILDTVADEMKDSFSDNIKIINELVQDNISVIKDDIQELVIRLTDINSLTVDVKNAIMDAFEGYLDNYSLKFEAITDNVKNCIDSSTEKLTERIAEYQKEVNKILDVDLSSYAEETKQFIKDEIESIKDKIDELNEKSSLDELANNNDVNLEDIIVSSTENINKRLETLRDIILSELSGEDTFVENFEEIKEKIDDVKDILNRIDSTSGQAPNVQVALDEISAKTDNFANIVKSENEALKDILAEYKSQINALSNLEGLSVSSNDEGTKEFIKGELGQLKEQFLRNLTSVFENISFIEESEEIQNAIWDNADIIKREITQLKQVLASQAEPTKADTSDIDKKFDKLKNILEGITTGNVENSEKYIYTLPDVEMDIAKMRMAISDVSDLIKQNREDGFDVAERLNAVDDIREDISSISKRTNKLILTSDDSNKYLKENIEDFKNILNAITKKCDKIDSAQLNQHLVDVKSLVMSGLKSDKILNEAFMHLAEWIDDSAKSMNTISSQVEVNKYTLSAMKTDLEKMESKSNEINIVKDEVEQLKTAIAELSTKLDKKSDIDYSKSLYEIEYGLDRISDKLDVQELKIKSLEKKLETLSAPQNPNEEINSLLEFIASQVTAANENSRNNRLLLQKVAMLEKQMGRFETSIAKITQFVDGSN